MSVSFEYRVYPTVSSVYLDFYTLSVSFVYAIYPTVFYVYLVFYTVSVSFEYRVYPTVSYVYLDFYTKILLLIGISNLNSRVCLGWLNSGLISEEGDRVSLKHIVVTSEIKTLVV